MIQILRARRVFIATALAGAGLACSAAGVAAQSLGDWTTHNANSRHTGYVPILTSTSDFTVLWSTKLPMEGTGFNPPVTGDGRVYLSDAVWFQTGHFHALNLADGSVQWSHEYTSPTYGGVPLMNAPAFHRGMAYVSTGGHEDAALWGYDAATGAQKFRAQIDAQWETYYGPTPQGNALYMNGGYYGGAYGFRARSGSQAWFTSLPQYDHWTPATDDNYVYAYTTQLDILDRRTGQVVSTIPDPNFAWWGYSVGCAPVLGSSQNLIVTQNQRMISFDLAAKTVAWEASVPSGYYELNQPSLADGTIYYGKGSTVYLLSEADGRRIFTWGLPNGGTIESTVVLTRNHFIVSSSQGTYAVSRKNPSSPAWHIAAHGQLALSREGVLVIAGPDGTVTGVRLR